MRNDTVAVVVTYNRSSLLKENIIALLNQTVSCDILIIDNASTDNTKEVVDSFQDSHITYYNAGKNLGGAGGFSIGTRLALENGYDYFWIMDDDAIPEATANEELLVAAKGLENNFSFLSSLVYWTNGQLFPMNTPSLSLDSKAETILESASKYNLIPISTASFVGCFVNAQVALEAGIPISEFFIYGDDVEYTTRLSSYSQAYVSLKSKIVHKAPSIVGSTDVSACAKDRIGRYYYHFRNRVYIAKKSGFKDCLRRAGSVFKASKNILEHSDDSKLDRLKVVFRGTFAGIIFNPQVQFVDKEKYYIARKKKS